MAIVVDAARANIDKNAHNTVYQKGNDNANTPTPTWLKSVGFLAAAAAETHINFAYEAGVDNTLDAWLPAEEEVFLDKTVATVRPT